MTAAREGILVSGITGHQGGAVAHALLRLGTRVVGLTRNAWKAAAWKDRGVRLEEADLTDRKAMVEALRRVEKAYLVTTFFGGGGAEEEIRQGTTMIDAAKEAGIGHLVMSSVVAADKGTGIPHFETKAVIEEHLRKSGVPFTVIRPVFFMENFLSDWMLPSLRSGKLTFPVRPERLLQMVALRDIADFVVAAFARHEFLGQTIEIAGDEQTLPDALRVVSRMLDHDIAYELLPDEALDPAVGSDMAAMFRWFNGTAHRIDFHELERKWEISMTRFRDFVMDAPWTDERHKAA